MKRSKRCTWAWGQGKRWMHLPMTGFEFYGDFDAARKDLKFGLGEYKKIRRAALVGDQKWLDWFARFIGRLTPAEEKHFTEGELQAALDWAAT